MTSSTALATAQASGLPPKVEPCVPAIMPGRGARGGEAGADREAAAQPLGDGGDVRAHARLLAGEQRAGAAHAGLDLVEHQQQAVLVAEGAQVLQALRRHRPDAALALDRLDQDGGGLGADRGVQRLVVAERHDVEARQQRIEAFDQLLAAGGGRDAGHGPAVEGALEGDDAVTLGRAAGRRSSGGPS